MPITITWVGHATVMIEVGGVRIVTDPLLTSSVAHLRRRLPVPEPNRADVVAISHLHLDHLHRRSIARVAGPATELLVPAGAAPLLHRLAVGGLRELNVGDTVAVGDGAATTVEAVPADHSGRRGPHSRRAGPALGYVVRSESGTVYFAGDTGLFDGMAAIGPVDVALLPIWGWGPSLGEHHLDPASAASATALLDATRVIPIHWGTYSPRRLGWGPPAWLDRPLADFRSALAAAGLVDRLVALQPGQGITVPEVAADRSGGERSGDRQGQGTQSDAVRDQRQTFERDADAQDDREHEDRRRRPGDGDHADHDGHDGQDEEQPAV